MIELCKRVEIDYANEELSVVDDDMFTNVRKAITSGFFYCTAKLQKSGSYRTLKNPHTVDVHPSSSMRETPPKYLVYFELVFTTKEFMRNVIEIEPEWLVEIAPHYYKEEDVIEGKREEKLKMPPPAKRARNQ